MNADASTFKWAEEFVSSCSDVCVALVQGNKLYMLDDVYNRTYDMLVYQFIRHGDPVPESWVIRQIGTSEGGIYITYAKLDPMHCDMEPEYEEIRRVLFDAWQKLQAFTHPGDHRQKVLELLRWSYLASHSDLV